jgi:hypothetical protein
MRIIFPKDNGITIDASMSCSTTDSSVYDGSPVCTSSEDGDENKIITIKTLKPQ